MMTAQKLTLFTGNLWHRKISVTLSCALVLWNFCVSLQSPLH